MSLLPTEEGFGRRRQCLRFRPRGARPVDLST